MAISGQESQIIHQPSQELADPLNESARRAHDDAGLGLEVLNTIMAAHHGTLMTSSKDSGGEAAVRVGFELDFPLSNPKGVLPCPRST
jgi:K+-sensing histidine kinase KdpD